MLHDGNQVKSNTRIISNVCILGGGVAGIVLANELKDKFEKILLTAQREWPIEAPYALAQLYAWTGNKDEAFAWLDRVPTHQVMYRLLARDALLHKLHSDQRWQTFLENRGLNSRHLANVNFDPLRHILKRN
mgnify:CR=1 FL=1